MRHNETCGPVEVGRILRCLRRQEKGTSASDEDVAAHDTSAELLAAIRDGVAKLGKTPATVTVDDLAPVDEFHVGGRPASVGRRSRVGGL